MRTLWFIAFTACAPSWVDTRPAWLPDTHIEEAQNAIEATDKRVSVVVILGGRITWARGFGTLDDGSEVTTQTRFELTATASELANTLLARRERIRRSGEREMMYLDPERGDGAIVIGEGVAEITALLARTYGWPEER